ncbi:MAG: hypothetical protein V1777_02830 [Candidatus Micrarchaeota archaeon]
MKNTIEELNLDFNVFRLLQSIQTEPFQKTGRLGRLIRITA